MSLVLESHFWLVTWVQISIIYFKEGIVFTDSLHQDHRPKVCGLGEMDQPERAGETNPKDETTQKGLIRPTQKALMRSTNPKGQDETNPKGL